LTLPAALNSLDEDTYLSNAGYPAHAALGRQIARNDRSLHANLRRTLVNEAFPIAGNGTPKQPTICHSAGVVLGPWPLPTTPDVVEGEWRVRGRWEANGVFLIVPFLETYSGARVNLPSGNTYTHGVATSEAVAGPFPMRLRYSDPPQWGGLVIYPETQAATGGNGSVADTGDDWIQSTAGSFAGWASPDF
tara:strand:- start:1412 stop:1984 length:573 start_codon:yes stop_codon:yes gene_type:complete